MRQFLLGVGISAVFGVGFVVGASTWAVPKAKAAEGETSRFAYFCFDASSTEDLHQKANQAGARGWKMVSGVAKDGRAATTWCFQR